LKTDWIYLPIYWTNNYVQRGFKADECAQGVLDSLDAGERYFTVVQCDDGIYERYPENLLVFGAGGVGDIPIPLLAAPPHPNGKHARDTLGSFMGTVECGGPAGEGKATESTWNPDGFGAMTRRAMFAAFAGTPGFYLRDCNVPVGEFRTQMHRSRFALCPRGYGRTSFRLYEAMEMGCVPVYIHADGAWLPYRDVLNWSELAVLCDIGEIASLPERLIGIDPYWTQQAREKLAVLSDDYFTMSGMCRQIFRMVKERT